MAAQASPAGSPAGLRGVELTTADRLLRGAEVSAVSVLVANVILWGLFIWAINPTSLSYSLRTAALYWPVLLVGVLALVLPALALAGSIGVRRTLRAGNWARARGWLRPLVWLGYANWIVPGYFLHETLNLLNAYASAPAGPSRTRSIS